MSSIIHETEGIADRGDGGREREEGQEGTYLSTASEVSVLRWLWMVSLVTGADWVVSTLSTPKFCSWPAWWAMVVLDWVEDMMGLLEGGRVGLVD
jgi:hypothetical protein